MSQGGRHPHRRTGQGLFKPSPEVPLSSPDPQEARASGITPRAGAKGEGRTSSFPCRICRRPGTERVGLAVTKTSLRPGPTSRQARYPTVTVFRMAGRPQSFEPATGGRSILKRFRSQHGCIFASLFRKESTSNDPSAGSPTETLLRLLLPLNHQVCITSQEVQPTRGRKHDSP